MKKIQSDQREAKIKMLHTSPLLCFTLQPKFHGNNNIERLLGNVWTESWNWLLLLLLVGSNFLFLFLSAQCEEQSKPHYQYKCHVDQQCYQSSNLQILKKNNIKTIISKLFIFVLKRYIVLKGYIFKQIFKKHCTDSCKAF